MAHAHRQCSGKVTITLRGEGDMSESRFTVPSRIAVLPCIALIACSDGSPTGTEDGDTTPPAVVSVTPLASASGVAIGTTLTVTFSEPVDAGTLTPATFVVTRAGGAVAGTVTTAGAIATFTPAQPLAELAAGYTAMITTGVRDTAGNAIAASHTWQFTTELVSPLYWYRLSNRFLGTGRSLDTTNDAEDRCVMSTTGPGSGQLRRFDVLVPGRFRMSNAFRGQSLSLEGSDGSDACRLDPAGPFTGQFWIIAPVPGRAGYFTLRTQFLGNARSLDTAGGTDVPYMAVTGPFTGQDWTAARVGPI